MLSSKGRVSLDWLYLQGDTETVLVAEARSFTKIMSVFHSSRERVQRTCHKACSALHHCVVTFLITTSLLVPYQTSTATIKDAVHQPDPLWQVHDEAAAHDAIRN
jgi:hypothetical protein